MPASRLPRNVVALGVVSLLTDASSEMIYPLLPVFLTVSLGASPAMLGAVEGAAESIAALLKLWSGQWSDRLARRKPLVVAGYAVSSALRPLIAMATAGWHVLVVRVGDRVGKGIRSSPRDALVADSTPPEIRGRAFGFHRALDHAGAVIGPLLAFALMAGAGATVRTVFWFAAIPGALAVIVLLAAVREQPRAVAATSRSPFSLRTWSTLPLPARRYFTVLFVFTLAAASDTFLLLRAVELGVAAGLIPLLWAAHNVTKSVLSTPAGALSDRIGRRPLIAAGWILYASVYAGFALANAAWQAWALFVAYAAFYALTEGVEKALVADLVPADMRGAAYGWFNLAVALGALPASLMFGAIWTKASPQLAFGVSAVLAVGAAAGLYLLRVGASETARPAGS